MTGKILSVAILLCALVAGGALYYLQVYGYYREIAQDTVLLTARATGTPEPIEARDIAAIDAGSSPIRYRACFATSARPDELADRFETLPDAVPRNAPGWFDCFDASALAADLDAGRAQAFLSEKNVHFGVDRIVAVTEDGRGYVWHDLNDCGEKSYDGTVVGEACPPRPAAGSQ